MKTRLLTPRSKGFTLIEVLVVIAIIALLAGVSYSIYSHATETAARTVDLELYENAAFPLSDIFLGLRLSLIHI